MRAFVHSYADLGANARRLLAGTICLWVGIGIFGVLFNLYLVAIGYSVVFVGVLAALSTVGQASVSPILGRLLRRWPASAVMTWACALSAVTMAASAVFTHPLMLILATVILGVGLAAATIPASPFIMEQVRADQRAHLFSAYTASTNVGAMLGSLLSGIVPAACGRMPFLQGHTVAQDRIGLLLGTAVTGISVLFLLRITGSGPGEEDPDLPSAMLDAPRIDQEETRADVLAMIIATAFIAVSLGLIYPLFNVYFATVHHTSVATIGVLYAVSGVFGTAASLLGPVVARRGTLSSLVVMRTLTAPIILLFWVHPVLAVAFVAYIGRNILGQLTGVLENTFSMERVPAGERGSVASWRTFSFNVGWTLGSVVAGLVVARFGFDSVFVASAVLTLAGSFTWYRRFGRRKLLVRFPLRPPGRRPHPDD